MYRRGVVECNFTEYLRTTDHTYHHVHVHVVLSVASLSKSISPVLIVLLKCSLLHSFSSPEH